MTTKLNDRQVKALIRRGEAGRYAAGNGLYLRISNESTSFWAVRYTIHGKRREITIGIYPALSLANAAAQAVLIKAGIKEGVDPLAERAREDSIEIKTVDQLANDWLVECDARLKHPRIPRRVYEKDISPMIGALSLKRITPRDIRAVIANITEGDTPRPTIANDALMYCKQLFNHGIKLDLMATNPASAFTIKDAGGIEKSRERTLTIQEVEKVFDTFRTHIDQFTRNNYLNVALLLALAVRKGELIAAKWDEFDLEKGIWHLPESRSKTAKAIDVPLVPEVIAWLQELRIRGYGSAYVFPKRMRSKRFGHASPDTINAAIGKLFKEKKMPVEHFTVHDLRRTTRTMLSKVKVLPHIAERYLNHALPGMQAIYNTDDHIDERKEAQEKIVAILAPIVNTPFSK